MLENLSEADIREACRRRLEAAEMWLRRLAHNTFFAVSANYLEHIDEAGDRLIKTAIAKNALARIAANAARYPRQIDALLLDDLINVIANPARYPLFKSALGRAYPEGRDEAQTFLTRMIGPRNKLAHANALTLREAEQVVCYAGDVIGSIKTHYEETNVANAFNVPIILRVTDSFGQSFERAQLPEVHDGGIGMFTHNSQHPPTLYPGDNLTLEVEVDPSFAAEDYTIQWASSKPLGDNVDINGPKLSVVVSEKMVGNYLSIHCTILSNNTWHRMADGWDDFLMVTYRVYPVEG